jgi:hypothetical protein
VATLKGTSTPSAALTVVAADSPSDGLRLRRRDPGIAGGFVDGGWWPHSLDLSVELPPLLAELSSSGYDIHRVTYNLAAWDPAPRSLTVSGRLVKLGGYRTQDTASITLIDTSGWKRIDLVVVAPQTKPEIAERVLALAGLDGDLHRIGQILDLAHGVADGGRVLAS